MMLVANLSGIKSMYVNSLALVRVKGGESKCFRIESCVRQCCVMSPWLFNIYMDAVRKEVKVGIWRMGIMLLEERRGWRLPGLLYV